MKILIVDDSEFMRNVIRRCLEVSGYNDFIEADSGTQAMLKISKADLLLTDLNMPGMDGELLIREIRQSKDFGQLPICVITGQKDINKVGNILRMGVDDYIAKPFNPQCLAAKIKKLEEKYLKQQTLH